MSGVRTVLVTGGCGSVGANVVSRLCERGSARNITVFDNDEQSLFAMRQEADDAGADIDFVMGDVRDQDRLAAAMGGVDHVIHAAGLKQVPQNELHPYESVMTNAVGTWNVVQAARQADVSAVLTVSTDKAVNPVSTMGASKMLAERISRAAHARSGPEGPRFDCVRLGNIVGSAGSVVPLFRSQIEDGGPVTVTDPEMTRFVMSEREAASFIVDRARDPGGGRIHVPKLDRLRIGDLARAMIEEYAPPGTPPERIEVERIGRRTGERIHEYLVGPAEVRRAFERDDGYCIRPPSDMHASSSAETDGADLPSSGYRSDTEPFLDADDLVDLVEAGLGPVPADPPVAEEARAAANYDSA